VLSFRCIFLSKLLNLFPHLLAITIHLLHDLKLNRLLSIVAMTILEFSQSVGRECGSQEVCITFGDGESKIDFTKTHETIVSPHSSDIMSEGQENSTSISMTINDSHRGKRESKKPG